MADKDNNKQFEELQKNLQSLFKNLNTDSMFVPMDKKSSKENQNFSEPDQSDNSNDNEILESIRNFDLKPREMLRIF